VGQPVTSRPAIRKAFAPTAEDLPVAFIGSYPPRRCGIATFTSDLASSVGAAGGFRRPTVVALTEPGSRYEYPREVSYEIRQNVRADYALAAEHLNDSHVRFVCIQHEHGIFGGNDGAYVLDFLGALRIPAVATLHTVLKHPSASQRAIVDEMSRVCAQTVVMSRVASDLLHESYGVELEKVRIIPHGIPDLASRDPARSKARLGVPGRRVLLTFGLLGPNKGIETVLRALPAVVEAFPDVIYFVVGATHPMIVRQHGEAYRASLEEEADRLGVREHVAFRNEFVSSEELGSYLQAADVYLSPYVNESQVTSGALSYAMGAGTAVISTPYWHAQELLANGLGRLFPFGDSEALGREICSLFGAPGELERIRSKAFESTRSMVWPEVGKTYFELASRAMGSARPATIRETRPSALPRLRLDHLIRLTDDTGVIQHATYTIPARKSGYCVDDNARALDVALRVDRLGAVPASSDLVTRYLAYLHAAQTDTGDFDNFLRYDRTSASGSTSEDCLGRALAALGATIEIASDEGARRLAREMFDRALPGALALGPRGTAGTVIGLTRRIAAEQSPHDLLETLRMLTSRLVRLYGREATEDWAWFEPTLTYDNALLPLALFEAFRATADPECLRVARESLEFLERVSFAGGHLALVGNDGWYTRGGSRPIAEEQPIDASAFVLAFRSAYQATGDHAYLRRMRESFAWFLGANRLRVPLYDESTAGCRDGLGAISANENQGAESTICFLLALLAMLDLAGEGLEHMTRLVGTGG
jgi:glycosyltransferase involved in cell wall biosynthesis